MSKEDKLLVLRNKAQVLGQTLQATPLPADSVQNASAEFALWLQNTNEDTLRQLLSQMSVEQLTAITEKTDEIVMQELSLNQLTSLFIPSYTPLEQVEKQAKKAMSALDSAFVHVYAQAYYTEAGKYLHGPFKEDIAMALAKAEGVATGLAAANMDDA